MSEEETEAGKQKRNLAYVASLMLSVPKVVDFGTSRKMLVLGMQLPISDQQQSLSYLVQFQRQCTFSAKTVTVTVTDQNQIVDLSADLGQQSKAVTVN